MTAISATSRTLVVSLLIGTAMVAFAPHAYADNNWVGPGVGSECYHFELNTVTTGWVRPATPGPVRCVAVPGEGYKWLPDSGQG